MNEDVYTEKIQQYIAGAGVKELREATVSLLTPDASARRYYRLLASSGQSYVASVYPEPFKKLQLPFLVLTDIFTAAELPVPKVFDVQGELGVVLQEDLGDVSLAQWLAAPGRTQIEVDNRVTEAITLIARIQALTDEVVSAQSLPATLAFDTEKLYWELNYFFEHYFGSLLRVELSAVESDNIKLELLQLAEWLCARPWVLTHRDFHAMNLMVDQTGQLRLIDYQDARMGPASYDLVPLLLERRLQPTPEEWVKGMQSHFLQARESVGLPALDLEEFQNEFVYMTVQRELKALGTFSYQAAVMNRGEVYGAYIKPTVELVLRYLLECGKYSSLRDALVRSVERLP